MSCGIMVALNCNDWDPTLKCNFEDICGLNIYIRIDACPMEQIASDNYCIYTCVNPEFNCFFKRISKISISFRTPILWKA